MFQFFIDNIESLNNALSTCTENESTQSGQRSMNQYSHQVGGHSTILSIEKKILKPLINRELQFYQYLSNYKIFHNFLLSPFVPRFYGHTEVLKTLYTTDISNNSNNSIKNNSNSNSSSNNSNSIKNNNNNNENIITFSSPSSSDSSKLKKKKPSSKHKIGTKKNYIILEDITVNYKKPCIVDIKIGTRQRGAVCSSTTSTSLGARVCGMKLYKENFGYIVFDRFYGRSLNPETLEDLLYHFFSLQSHQRHHRIHLLNNIIEKLSQIHKIHLVVVAVRVVVIPLHCRLVVDQILYLIVDILPIVQMVLIFLNWKN